MPLTDPSTSPMSTMHTSLAVLFAELTDGPPPEAAYMLNSGDAGLAAFDLRRD